MDKKVISEFFNRLAPTWESGLEHDDVKIRKILDYADICEGVSILDVACGTGVLFPDYLSREVKSVLGVDISSAMLELAQSKFGSESRIQLLNADIEECEIGLFDRCMVYNAFPHFPNPRRLIACLAEKITDGGRLTISHSMSRAKLDEHHDGKASEVSLHLLSAEELSAIMLQYFDVDVMISDDEMYVVSGVKNNIYKKVTHAEPKKAV